MAPAAVTPLLKQDVLAILQLMRGTKGVRDRALILLGFAAALRRSELVALDLSDLAFVNEGLIVHPCAAARLIRRAKAGR
jgi:integrase